MRRARSWVALGVVLAARASGARTAGAAPDASGNANGSEPPHVADASTSAGAGARTQIIPLPLFATLPNEGNTYGVLPVFLRIDASGKTTSITAPSISWNSSAGVNTTFRFYDVASDIRSWSLIAAYATRVNRSLRFQYKDTPGDRGRWTVEVHLIARRSLFFRYFGTGPDTTTAGESSYARALGFASVRTGLNVWPHFNAGLRAAIRGDQPERHTLGDLPASQDRYPDAPGLEGGTVLGTAELSLRFDTRQEGDYAERGVASELHVARNFGIERSDSFWQLTWHTRVLFREASFLTGAARLYMTDELGGARVPLYYRSTLGGDTLFRGFADDRFVDRGAWEAELEQRFRVLQTHLFGVTADWRIDPFVAVGQVYPRYGELVSHVRIAWGAGFRAFVHPNVLGRVDLAYASDGFKAYVTLGYPY